MGDTMTLEDVAADHERQSMRRTDQYGNVGKPDAGTVQFHSAAAQLIRSTTGERDELRERALNLATGLQEWQALHAEQETRAEKAEADLADCKAAKNQLENELADMRCDKLNNEAMRAEANELTDAACERADSAEAKANSWMNQAWRLESELDALKKRPATEPQRVPIDCIVHVTVSESWRGKRVRLVVEDDNV